MAEIEHFSTTSDLAIGVADALVAELEMLQRQGHRPRIVLTGGRIAAAIHSAIVREPGSVDWADVEVWFSDERFLPEGHPERNYEQAQDALFRHMPFDYGRLHPMPCASVSDDNDVEQAAREYAEELRNTAPTTGPWFDIALLSIGPDGHCASLFPGRTEADGAEPAVAVLNAPKLPSTRISMSLCTLGRSRQVWLIAAGAEKARAVADAVSSIDPAAVPAAGARGLNRTVWFLDAAAAGALVG